MLRFRYIYSLIFKHLRVKSLTGLHSVPVGTKNADANQLYIHVQYGPTFSCNHLVLESEVLAGRK